MIIIPLYLSAIYLCAAWLTLYTPSFVEVA